MNISSIFPVDTLRTCLPPASTHLISLPHSDAILRFFDSPPFSPSNKYVSFAQFHRSFEESSADHWANITVVNLQTGASTVVDTTLAWETQVGAHVQWGADDSALYYNKFVDRSQGGRFEDPMLLGRAIYAARGVHYNILDSSFRYLDCPVYHISADGKWGVAPNLYKIGYTQQGYGIKAKNGGLLLPRNEKAVADDGLFLTDIEKGQCRLLVSLRELALLAGLDTESTPTYGFHTKWSHDGETILFVMRTLERAVSGAVSAGVNKMMGKKATVRVQHLFWIPRSGVGAKYILSWSSATFYTKSGIQMNLLNGNHPNWVPNSHFVSINMENNAQVTAAKDTSKASGAIVPRKGWNIVVADLDKVPSDNTLLKYRHFVNQCRSNTDCALWRPTNLAGLVAHRGSALDELQGFELPVYSVYAMGTGHPNADRTGRYIFTDAYVKERSQFSVLRPEDKGQREELRLRDFMVPLRLIDTVQQEEVWVVQIPIADRSVSDPLDVDNAWRCDPHPAWSRDFKYVAFNGRPDGVHRQLYISYLGDDLQRIFNGCPKMSTGWNKKHVSGPVSSQTAAAE